MGLELKVQRELHIKYVIREFLALHFSPPFGMILFKNRFNS